MKTCGVVLEMLLTSDEVNTAWMTNLFNQIFAESKVPEDWITSVIVDCFKNRVEATKWGNSRELKLLEHMLKGFKRFLQYKVR